MAGIIIAIILAALAVVLFVLAIASEHIYLLLGVVVLYFIYRHYHPKENLPAKPKNKKGRYDNSYYDLP
jgi:4-hydroxybenzoate polyprenyltransferase